MFFFVIAYKDSVFQAVLAGRHHACEDNDLSIFFLKESPSVGKIENFYITIHVQ